MQRTRGVHGTDASAADSTARLAGLLIDYSARYADLPCAFSDVAQWAVAFSHPHGVPADAVDGGGAVAGACAPATVATPFAPKPVGLTEQAPRFEVAGSEDSRARLVAHHVREAAAAALGERDLALLAVPSAGSSPRAVAGEFGRRVRRFVSATQMLRFLGEHHRLEAPAARGLVATLMAVWSAAQEVNAALALDAREARIGDECALLACHVLNDLALRALGGEDAVAGCAARVRAALLRGGARVCVRAQRTGRAAVLAGGGGALAARAARVGPQPPVHAVSGAARAARAPVVRSAMNVWLWPGARVPCAGFLWRAVGGVQ